MGRELHFDSAECLLDGAFKPIPLLWFVLFSTSFLGICVIRSVERLMRVILQGLPSREDEACSSFVRIRE